MPHTPLPYKTLQPPRLPLRTTPPMARKRLLPSSSSDEAAGGGGGGGGDAGSDGEAARCRAERKKRPIGEVYESGDLRGRRGVKKEEEEGEGEEEEGPPDARPVGEVVMTAGRGKSRVRYFREFDYDGTVYELGDPVMIQPEIESERPYVGILKYITQEADGSVKVTGQWFYRPEEAKQRCGGTWPAIDNRELFYSFHLDEVPAESVMHKCVVHFVPPNKKLPVRKQHPGFVVQRVYDFIEKRLWNLSDKDYKDNMQHEIDNLVQKTIERIGELPDIELDNSFADHAEQTIVKTTVLKNAQPDDVSRNHDAITLEHLVKAVAPGICTNSSEQTISKTVLKNTQLSDIARTNDGCTRSSPLMKAKTSGLCTSSSAQTTSKKTFHKTQLLDFSRTNGATRVDSLRKVKTGSCINDASKYQRVLSFFKALTGDEHRDKWLEKLLEHVEPACSLNQVDMDMKSEDGVTDLWPDAAVRVITALEKASYDALGGNLKAYNAKIRQLVFNLKNTIVLTKRLLNKELDPVVVVNMHADELKAGSIAETPTTEPEESATMQRINAKCSICSKYAIGIRNVIHTAREDRYELVCTKCGYESYASQDYVLSLSNDTPQKAVGNAPN